MAVSFSSNHFSRCTEFIVSMDDAGNVINPCASISNGVAAREIGCRRMSVDSGDFAASRAFSPATTSNCVERDRNWS
jgi:hypothetical protein